MGSKKEDKSPEDAAATKAANKERRARKKEAKKLKEKARLAVVPVGGSAARAESAFALSSGAPRAIFTAWVKEYEKNLREIPVLVG